MALKTFFLLFILYKWIILNFNSQYFSYNHFLKIKFHPCINDCNIGIILRKPYGLNLIPLKSFTLYFLVFTNILITLNTQFCFLVNLLLLSKISLPWLSLEGTKYPCFYPPPSLLCSTKYPQVFATL